MCNNSEASSTGIRMATGPLKVYPMEKGSSLNHHSAEREQESTCSLVENVDGCSCTSSSSPITSAQANVDEPLAMDVLRIMSRQEASIYHHSVSYYVQHYHAKQQQQQEHGSSTTTSRRKKNMETMDSWRSSLIQWMYQVADFSHVRRETVGVAVYFLDTAISKIIVPAMNRNNNNNSSYSRTNTTVYCHTLEDYKVSFQLAAATCLQLAIKTHDCRLIKLQDLIILGRNAFTERDIVRMEVQIIEACSWYLHPPSIYCYLHQYQSLLLDILQQDDDSQSSSLDRQEEQRSKKTMMTTIGKLVHTITEIILPQEEYKSYPPSIVAYAIILVAMALKPTIVSPQQRQHLSRLVSLALLLLPNNNNNKDKLQAQQQQQQQDQQFVLLQTIRQIQASCQASSHLNCAGLLKDLVILESSMDGQKKASTATLSSRSLVCLTLDDFATFAITTGPPTTPPKGTSSLSFWYSSSSMVHSKLINHDDDTDSSPESPISVTDNHSSLLPLLQNLSTNTLEHTTSSSNI